MGISHRTGVSVSVSDLRSGLTLSHEPPHPPEPSVALQLQDVFRH